MTSPRYSADEIEQAFGFRPDKFLGGGSFGDTWRFSDRAIKIICEDAYPQTLIDREVDGLRRVSSEYVVKLIESRSIQLGGATRSVLVFEYIEGGDIQQRINAAQWPDLADSIEFLHGMLIGIRDLHATNTVHRDIKPANIALREGRWDKPVILDLGLSRGIDEPTFTRYPARVGSDLYMAPEQLMAQRARKAADLFAIGVTARYLIGRSHPFYDSKRMFTHDDLVKSINAGPLPLGSDVPGSVVDLLDRLTAPVESGRGSASSNLRRIEKIKETI